MAPRRRNGKKIESVFDSEFRDEQRSVTSLVPYAKNARTHSDAQIDQIAASIKQFGLTTRILIDDSGAIIAGHGRVLAAKKLGIEELPVRIAIGWSDAHKRAYVIADNQLALNAGWDEELLRSEVKSLQMFDPSFDLNMIGFDAEKITSLFLPRAEGETNPLDEWMGMPEYDQQDKMAFRTIKVHFADQKSVDQFAKLVKPKIGPKTKYIWFPDIVIAPQANKTYRSSTEKKKRSNAAKVPAIHSVKGATRKQAHRQNA